MDLSMFCKHAWYFWCFFSFQLLVGVFSALNFTQIDIVYWLYDIEAYAQYENLRRHNK